MHDPTTTEFQQIEREPLTELPAYTSPILQHLDAALLPNPSPACETCPASMWFSTRNKLQCFCTRMHLIVWDEEQPPIMNCDGRELALLALVESEAP